jgi:hypothetical protein
MIDFAADKQKESLCPHALVLVLRIESHTAGKWRGEKKSNRRKRQTNKE